MTRLALVFSLGFWIAPALADEEEGIPPPLERRVDFETDVRPLLTARCLACHGPDKQKGGLRLDRKSAAFAGGDEGDDIIPGDGAESLVVRLTAGAEDDRLMPPKGARLAPEQVALLRTWIDQGANWPGGDDDPRDWWSLRPLARAEVPTAEPFADAPPARNPIDAFIRAKLREKGLAPAPEADRRTLIRRLSFDLVGLPPSPEEIAAFVADPDPPAYEKLVDRLLASPRYGERWARHWLDAVHYGDSHGYDKDKPRPNAWPYRDYVIRAFNADKPYGRFVAEQVAGDVLFPDDPDGIVALGFLASGPWDFVGHAEVPETKIDGRIARHLDRDDMVAVTINTFLGLTAQCAQCHDHKFDPIAQEDYYRLQAVFAAVDRADRPYYADPALARRVRELTALRDQRESERERVEAELAALPPPSLVYAATIYDGGDAPFRGTGPDGGKPRPIHVLFRGDVRNPRKEVGPGALEVFADLPGEFDLSPDAPDGQRRAALARWLSDRRNPLVWRAIVNRVWQHHFGNGIVATPGDFGRMGEPPTHPELLDWLALNFRDGGQSIKDLHRLIVTSATYRQSSAGNPDFEAIDAGDSYLWRAPRRKLEAEAVRDAALAVAGQLDPAMYGPAFQDFVIERPEHSPHYQYDLQPPDDPRINRRAIYRFLVRSKLQPFMTALDCADPSMRVDKRSETASPLQALALYNNGLMLTMAKHLAERVEPAGDRRAQVARAFALAVGREPSDEELSALDAHAAESGMASACRVIFNLNEVLFID